MNHADHVFLLRKGVPQPGGVWADLGAGHGAFTLALADLLGPGGTIYAVDKDRGALGQLGQSLGARFPAITLHTVVADFSGPLALPPLDGLVMANALHFIARPQQEGLVRRLQRCLRPEGRFLLVEYNTDRGNHWVPHPLSFSAWAALAQRAGFGRTDLLSTRPSNFLGEFYAAASWQPSA